MEKEAGFLILSASVLSKSSVSKLTFSDTENIDAWSQTLSLGTSSSYVGIVLLFLSSILSLAGSTLVPPDTAEHTYVSLAPFDIQTD